MRSEAVGRLQEWLIRGTLLDVPYVVQGSKNLL